MKKTKLYLITAFVSAIMLAGCDKKKDGPEPTTQEPPRFSASIEKVSGKTSLDSDLKIHWGANDSISIFAASENTPYRFTGLDNNGNGDFICASASGFPAESQIKAFYAVYPYNENIRIDGQRRLQLTLPAAQDYSAGPFGTGVNTMVAVSAGAKSYDLPFQNLCGYLVVRLYGEGSIKALVLEGNQREKLSGAATVTAFHDDTPVLTMDASAGNSVRIDCGAVKLGTSAETATEFWFVIPPTTFTSGFTVSAISTDGTRATIMHGKRTIVYRNVVSSLEPWEAEFVQPDITLDAKKLTCFADEAKLAVYVEAPEGTTYTPSIPAEAQDWLQVNSNPESGNGFIYFSVAKNTTSQDRSAAVQIRYGGQLQKTVTINQKGYVKRDKFAEWGLKGDFVSALSNDRPYEWYIDQGDTGACSDSNCGPASSAMSARWYNGLFRGTAEEAREEIYNNGGWWYTNDIANYFASHGIANQFIRYSNDALVAELDKGNILLLCLDMYYVTYGDAAGEHVNKFYYTTTTGWGHFIVVKGYVRTSQKLYLEVYDPYSIWSAYPDGELKGKDRYYDAEDIQYSAGVWWHNMISIGSNLPAAVMGIPEIQHQFRR